MAASAPHSRNALAANVALSLASVIHMTLHMPCWPLHVGQATQTFVGRLTAEPNLSAGRPGNAASLGLQYCSLLMRIEIMDMYTAAEDLDLLTAQKTELTPQVRHTRPPSTLHFPVSSHSLACSQSAWISTHECPRQLVSLCMSTHRTVHCYTGHSLLVIALWRSFQAAQAAMLAI